MNRIEKMTDLKMNSLLRLIVLSPLALLIIEIQPVFGQWSDEPVLPGNGLLTVEWKPETSVEKVRIRISNSGDPWNEIPVTGSGENSYTITGLENFRSYEIQLGSHGDQWSALYHARSRGRQYPTGLHAGGQINAVARVADGVMLIGGDVGCIHRSIDGGETWYHSFEGIVSAPAGWKIGSLEYDPVSGSIYALAGKRDVGYFYVSTDNGSSWSLTSSGSALAVDANTGNYPRAVGRLIATDPDDPVLLFIGGRKGVKKSVDGGKNWTGLAYDGQEIRCLIFSGEYLYAAVRGTGVCRISRDGELMVYSGMGAPTMPEEILSLGGNLYVAAHNKGILRLSGYENAAADEPWTNLEIGTPGRWSAIHGYVKKGDHVLYAGNSHETAELPDGRRTTLMKCMNAQANEGFDWINVSSAENIAVNAEIAAGNGETYWRVDINKTENFYSSWGAEKRIDGHVFAIDQILVDTSRPDRVHVVGQMGLWRSLDGGLSWNPPVIGLGLAVHNCAAVNYSRPGHVYVGDTDNGMWVSHDYCESLAYVTRPVNPGVKPIIYDIFVDSLDESLYAAGKDDAWRYDLRNRQWDRVRDRNGNSLIDLTGGKIVHGVAAGRKHGKTVVLAAVQRDGAWCLQPGGAWFKPENGPPCQEGGILGTPFCWPDNHTGLVYFFDLNSGLWRSRDAGASWTRIWDKTNSARFSGSLAATAPDTLFLATGDACYRLTETIKSPEFGHPCSDIKITDTGIRNPGMLATYHDRVYVTGTSTASGTGDVVLQVSKDGGDSFTVISGDFYRGAAALPCRLALDQRYVYTVTNSMGTLVSNKE